jgi:hypothetical protein
MDRNDERLARRERLQAGLMAILPARDRGGPTA